MTTSIFRYSNTMMNYILGNNSYYWIYPTSYFLILLPFPSLVLSVYLTFAVTKEPTPVFILPHFAFFLYIIILSTCKLIINLDVEVNYWLCLRSAIALFNTFVCVKSNSYKNQNPTKNARALRKNNYSTRKSESGKWIEPKSFTENN